MQKLIYKPTAGAGFSTEKAQVIGEFLETLGPFTPSDVVNAARPANSPIHDQFEWDDLKAAEMYRVTEARHLVNHLTVVIKVADKETETKAFHSITVQDSEEKVEQRYTSVRVVVKNEDMRQQVVANALRELQGWQERYQQYSEVIGPSLFEEITRTVRKAKSRKREQVLQATA